jgi:hypothetical protein
MRRQMPRLFTSGGRRIAFALALLALVALASTSRFDSRESLPPSHPGIILLVVAGVVLMVAVGASGLLAGWYAAFAIPAERRSS